MARQYLDALIEEATPTQAERFQLVVHATADQLAAPDDPDPSLLDGEAGAGGAEFANGLPLHPSTLRRLTCDCPTATLFEDDGGTVLHLGRRSRRISGRLRRAVEARDRGMCATPGCTEPATQIHHIRHWAHGGPTCLRNLISLCDGHHWLVHEGGFTIATRSPGRWALLGPTGVVVEPDPPAMRGAETVRRDAGVAADAVTGDWDGDAMTDYALDVILSTIGAFEPTRSSTDVSAETSRPLRVA